MASEEQKVADTDDGDEVQSKNLKRWKPSKGELQEAREHCKESSAGYRDGKWVPLCMHTRDMNTFGAGIQLQFLFNSGFQRLMWFCAVCAAPYIVYCLLGNNMSNGDYVESSKEDTVFEYVTRTTPANMGDEETWGGVVVDRASPGVPYIMDDWVFSKDVGWWVSCIDALCVLLVFFVALWYELRVIPSASAEHRLAESFSVYVDCLPRRLPGDSHLNYEEELKKHFARILRAELHPEGLQVPAGLRVIKKSDPGKDGYKPPRLCGLSWCCKRAAPYDSKGRHVGKVVKGKGSEGLQVQWKKGGDNTPSLQELQPAEVYDHSLLKRIEFEKEADNFVEEDIMIHEVSLVRDFGGTLKKLKKEARKKQKELARDEAMIEANPQNKQEIQKQIRARAVDEQNTRRDIYDEAKGKVPGGKLAKVNMSLNIPFEERNVLGAYVIFTRRRNRNFVFQEYRFSRTFLRPFQRQGLRFFGNKIRVREATDPSEVFWENMDVTTKQQILRALFVVLIAFLIILVSVFFFATAKDASEKAKEDATIICNTTQVFVDTCLSNTDCECVNAGLFNVVQDEPAGIKACCDSGDDSWLTQQYTAQSYTMAAAVAPAVMNQVIAIVITLLANFLKKQTLTATNISIMSMTTIVLLANMVVAVILVHSKFGTDYVDWVQSWYRDVDYVDWPVGAGSYSELDPSWYIDVGATVIITLAISSVSLPAAMPAMYMMHLFFKKCFARRQKDSNSLRDLFTKPRYELAKISAQDGAMIIACIAFAGGWPVLWAVLAFYLTVASFMKKWTLFRLSTEPPHFSHHLATMNAIYVQIAVLIHAFFALRVFSVPETLPSDTMDSFYGDRGFNTNTSSSLVSSADDIPVISSFTARSDYVNTHPHWFVIAVVLVVGVLRLLAFFFAQGAEAIRIVIASLFAGKAGSHSEGTCKMCADTLCNNPCGKCLWALGRCLTWFFRYIAACLADFLPNELTKVMAQPFSKEPLEHFRNNKIPHSYTLEAYGPEMAWVQTGAAKHEELRSRLSQSGSQDSAGAPAQAAQAARAPGQESGGGVQSTIDSL